MIVKNEEKVLERCLKSIAPFVKEIIIVDTGSTDSTVQIAKRFTDKVFFFEWINDFSAARNFAFSKTTMPYIMWMDADDILKEKDQKLFKEFLTNAPLENDVFYLKYDVAFDEFDNTTFSYFRERIFKREKNPVWIDPIHETCFCAGKHHFIDIAISHKKEKVASPKRNLNIYNKLKREKRPFSARMTYYYARELSAHKFYNKALKEFKKFLKMPDGWSQNKIEACFEMAKIYFEKKEFTSALKILFESFCHGLPNGEVLCLIGQIYFELNNYSFAIYWYEQALEKAVKPQNGFVQEDFYGYVPAINLCVLYHRLGNNFKAKYYNDIAGKHKPLDEAFLFNKNFFETLKDW